MFEILTQDLDMKCLIAKFVPQLLLPEQKEHSAAFANNLIQTTSRESDFLQKVITGDESCIYNYEYDLEMKAKSYQWKSPGSPCLKNVHQSHSKIKNMLTVFFHPEGVVHHEYVPSGQTINEYYLNVPHWLKDAIR